MTPQQQIDLAEHLRNLANKVSKQDHNHAWLQGNLEGLAEMLELTVEVVE